MYQAQFPLPLILLLLPSSPPHPLLREDEDSHEESTKTVT